MRNTLRWIAGISCCCRVILSIDGGRSPVGASATASAPLAQ